MWGHPMCIKLRYGEAEAGDHKGLCWRMKERVESGVIPPKTVAFWLAKDAKNALFWPDSIRSVIRQQSLKAHPTLHRRPRPYG
jgi:hypothetical protein